MSNQKKPRLIVLTDIGGDPDDEQSFVRLLVHADQFDIEGIIPDLWIEHKGRHGVLTADSQMGIVYQALDLYAESHDNLCKHAPGFPGVDQLRSIVKRGAVDVRHPETDGALADVSSLVGEHRRCEGADWIISVVDRDDPRPLNITIWGGSATLAQALWQVQHTRTSRELSAFLTKLRVHAISDQDDTGPWIRNEFPELFYILDHARNGNKLESCYRGMFLGGDESLTSRNWVETHVRADHGSLGEWYPTKTVTFSNPHGCMKEGDTPSWFYFLHNGLQIPERPNAGGWGGRFEHNGAFYQDSEDRVGKEKSHRATVHRWRPAFQNEFAARMDWCVRTPEDANHPPVAIIDGDAGPTPVIRSAQVGDVLLFDACESHDPDGDTLFFHWWQYREAGTYRHPVRISDCYSPLVAVPISEDAAGSELHIILEVTDNGTPRLTSYRRVIVSVAQDASKSY